MEYEREENDRRKKGKRGSNESKTECKDRRERRKNQRIVRRWLADARALSCDLIGCETKIDRESREEKRKRKEKKRKEKKRKGNERRGKNRREGKRKRRRGRDLDHDARVLSRDFIGCETKIDRDISILLPKVEEWLCESECDAEIMKRTRVTDGSERMFG